MAGLEIGLPIIRPSKVESMTLLPQSLKTGHVYRGKNPRCSNGYVNERQIIWMNEEQVQYNGPAVAHWPQLSDYPHEQIPPMGIP